MKKLYNDVPFMNKKKSVSNEELQTQLAQSTKLINAAPIKVNSGSKTAKAFSTLATALSSGTVNVTVWGDSISTTGADSLTLTDMYYFRLQSLLRDRYPNVTFNFTNRAIGGTRIDQWNTDQTFSSVAKAWIEHIKDSAPDLLIIGWGMNHDTYLKAKVFKFHMKSVLDYINANFTKKPSIAIVTTPRPTVNGTYAGTEAQEAREMAAFSAREYGYAKDCYVIDVNRLFNIKRNGKDVAQIQNTRAVATTDAELDPIEWGTYTKNATTYTFQTTSQYMIIDGILLNNFKLYFDLTMSGIPVGNENLRIEFGNSAYPNVLMMFGNRSDLVTIRSYADNPDFGNLGSNPTATYTAPVAWSGLAARRCWIQKIGNVLEVYVNDVLVLRDKIQVNNLPGRIRLVKDTGSVGIVNLTNIKLYACDEKQYQVSLTDELMYGTYIEGNTGTKAPYGGNGINHPSSIGLNEVYVPALKEFVDDLPAV